MIRLPFGHVTVKKRDGTKEKIGAVMRRMNNAEIIELFNKYLADTNRMDFHISRGMLYQILDHCSASPRKSFTCVDYFVVDADEVFE